MKRLVDDFLDVSAIEAGRFEWIFSRPPSMMSCVTACELNNLQAAKKGIDLQVQCDENIPRHRHGCTQDRTGHNQSGLECH